MNRIEEKHHGTAFHLIIWIFVLKYELKPFEENKIKKIYGNPEQSGINPIIYIEELKKVLSQVREAKLIKLVASKGNI